MKQQLSPTVAIAMIAVVAVAAVAILWTSMNGHRVATGKVAPAAAIAAPSNFTTQSGSVQLPAGVGIPAGAPGSTSGPQTASAGAAPAVQGGGGAPGSAPSGYAPPGAAGQMPGGYAPPGAGVPH